MVNSTLAEAIADHARDAGWACRVVSGWGGYVLLTFEDVENAPVVDASLDERIQVIVALPSEAPGDFIQRAEADFAARHFDPVQRRFQLADEVAAEAVSRGEKPAEAVNVDRLAEILRVSGNPALAVFAQIVLDHLEHARQIALREREERALAARREIAVREIRDAMLAARPLVQAHLDRMPGSSRGQEALEKLDTALALFSMPVDMRAA